VFFNFVFLLLKISFEDEDRLLLNELPPPPVLEKPDEVVIRDDIVEDTGDSIEVSTLLLLLFRVGAFSCW
jgi:hypothetical protein